MAYKNANETSVEQKFTKNMLDNAKNVSREVVIPKDRNIITIYYKVITKRVFGADTDSFPCSCQGKHPTDFVSADN